jgi:hypothetical protein
MTVKLCTWHEDASERCKREATREISYHPDSGMPTGALEPMCNEHAAMWRQGMLLDLAARYITDKPVELPAELQCESNHSVSRRATIAVVIYPKGGMPVVRRRCHNCIIDEEVSLKADKLSYSVVPI